MQIEVLAAKGQGMSNRIFPHLIQAGGETYELSEPVTGLGRAHDNQIFLDSTRVSRYHAQVYFKEGRYWLRDLNSKNGCWVNRELVEGERQLDEGDLITLGNIHLTFHTNPDSNLETVSDYQTRLPPAALEIDVEAMEVSLNGVLLDPPLSPLEWRLLKVLYENRGRVCPRDLIIETVYQPADLQSIPFDSAIETLVSRLRKRLQLASSTQLPRLRTVRGVGYKLEF